MSECWDSGGLGFILSVGECDGNRLRVADKQARHAITIQDKTRVGHLKLRLSMQWPAHGRIAVNVSLIGSM